MRRGVLVTLIAASLLAAAPVAAAAPNSGLPGSTCAGTADANAIYAPPGRGVKTTGLGTDAPAYYEIGAPSGRYVGKAPKAVMIVIHPGGWYLVGREVLAKWARPMANRWRAAGWLTVNVDYRPCGQSIDDVLWFMRRVRQLHPRATICATGSSAGGHLAVLLASMRNDLACAISHAGPTDLLSLDHQTAVDADGNRSHDGPRQLSNMAIAAFGEKPAYRSPRHLAAQVKARVLLATGRTDPLVPRAQDASFAKTLRSTRPAAYVDVLSLPPGSAYFVHTWVSQASLRELRAREDALVAPLLATR